MFEFATALVSIATLLVPPACDGPSVAVAEARELIGRQQFSPAIEALENILPAAQGDPAVLSLLRQAYRGEIRARIVAGDRDAAQHLMDRLSLIDTHESDGTPVSQSATTAAPPSSDSIKVVMPKPATVSVAAPATNGWRPARVRTPREPATRTAEPSSVATPRPMPATASARITGVTQSQQLSGAVPDAHDLSLVELADALFLAQEFDEAAKRYAEAHSIEKVLPTGASNRWVYCRLSQVVPRMNASDASPEEWLAIKRELNELTVLAPSNDFIRTLLVTADRQATRGVPAFANRTESGTVIRATEPDAELRTTGNLLASLSARIARSVGADRERRSLWRRFRSGKWQVLETSNFRVHGSNEDLAAAVADVAESTRIEVYRTWFGRLPETNWVPKCEIFIHDSPEEYARITRQGPGSPGHSQTGINAGRITSRRVDLRRGADDIIDAVLPHEVTHVVLSDRFNTTPMPRWADEGLAVLTEPVEKKRAHLRNLGDISKRRRPYSARQLMTMKEYPPGDQWPLFYAESVSLVEFLATRDGSPRFIEFMQMAQTSGYEPALKHIYNIDGFAELERVWSAGRAEQIALATP